MKEVIEVPDVSAALRRLQTPTSLLIRAGGLLYSCGIPPIDPVTGAIVEGDIGEQTHAIFRIMKLALAAAGSGLEKVRECEAADCVMLFRPAHPRRRWCSPTRCGNRARVARYYQRHKPPVG